QIAFAVIATTLVLVSVFLPISFLEGQAGRLFSEFGFALAASVLISGFVALSLTPMMCSKLLRAHSADGRLVRWTEPAFAALNGGFRWTLERALRAPLVVLAGAGALSLLAVSLFQALPKEFAPTEDRGVVVVPVTAPEGASFAYTREHVMKIEDILIPYVERGVGTVVFASIGGFQRPAVSNTANVFLRLVPWHERTVKQQQIAAEIFPRVAAIPGVRAFAVNPGSLGTRGFQAPIQLVLQGPDYETLVLWRDAVIEAARQSPLLTNLDSNFRETKPEIRVEIDRRRAADLGVSIQAIGRTLESMLGSREVGTFVERGNEYRVLIQAEATDRATPYDLQNIFVRTASGALVPLSNFVSLSERARPQSLNREDRLRSITVTANLAPNVLLGDGMAAIEAAARSVLPPEARTTWRGQSREFVEGSSALLITFALALLIVFLVLAAQFESFVHPFIILLSTPLAVTGGLLSLHALGLSLNIFSQIGLVLLIGLMAKNGILVVEFANQLRDEGRSVRDAVLEASVARLRPILMTTIATILGAWPLATATGAGAESREALGVVIIGGMSLSTLVTLYAIPALYLLLAPLTRPTGEIARRLAALDRPSPRPVPAE
ncbi:MAG: efflux RND transporter permease subunit, partial [Acetobacteraceae bacterium]